MANSLKDQRYLSLATQKRDATWVWTPIWFADAKNGEFVAFSAGRAGKVKRIRNFSNVQVMACTVSGKALGEAHQGRARLIHDPTECDAAYQALKHKYGWQMRFLDFFSGLAGNIKRRQVIGFRIDEQF